ncbi:OmpW/AlkL family protein [Derxia lacustris]|uniref:OmpW/AlkL family protein n=1 Tax=Derxia lacustris TaxID=764842 RepID=UPI001F1F2E51|nr:OmpW family outer membrane protein [Derxia lacustris]
MNAFLKTSLIAGLIAAGFAALPAQAAGDSPWLVRGRLLFMQTAEKSDAVPGVAQADAIRVASKVFPDFDISYFFTPNISAELVLTYPQIHDVELNGGKIGSLKHLPPTLLAQYHFDTGTAFVPYVGAGVNYTRIWGVTWDPAVKPLNLSLENKSIGPALQIGADYKLDKVWSLNADIKYIKLESDLSSNGKKISTVSLNPWLFGVGVGYRF